MLNKYNLIQNKNKKSNRNVVIKFFSVHIPVHNLVYRFYEGYLLKKKK